MIKDLLTSKRFWGIVVAGGVYLAAHFHVVISSDAANVIIEQLALAAGAIWTVVTRVIDSAKA